MFLFLKTWCEFKRGKYISCRASNQERFIRLKTLGSSYT